MQNQLHHANTKYIMHKCNTIYKTHSKSRGKSRNKDQATLQVYIANVLRFGLTTLAEAA